MTIVATSIVFGAESESVITWGRQFTDPELALIQAKKGTMFSEGKFGSFPLTVDGIQTAQWVNTAAATEWVAFCNTFTPPPTSAVVQDIPEPTPPSE